jgi:hypothetical protein
VASLRGANVADAGTQLVCFGPQAVGVDVGVGVGLGVDVGVDVGVGVGVEVGVETPPV